MNLNAARINRIPRGFTIIANGVIQGKSFEGGSVDEAIREFKERLKWDEDESGILYVPLHESHPCG